MKKMIYVIMGLLLISSVFAVTRSISGKTVTYAANTAFNSGIQKAYWAVEDTISGCSLDNIAKTSCGPNCEYSISGGNIRLVAFPPDETGSTPIGNSKLITLSGTGKTCTLSGNYAESPGTTGTLLVMGVSNSFSIQCNGNADRDCSGIVSGQEILEAINAYRGSPAIFPLGTFTFENIGDQFRAYYGAIL